MKRIHILKYEAGKLRLEKHFGDLNNVFAYIKENNIKNFKVQTKRAK